ncbi:leukocyte receptor cluster member 1 homolog [Erpetoichthys calabaricus]|uniref:Leukocyte receptor cluster member 1-like n=1 Tax=Erpetoichthys calabaricus TaxID=27687 RepID=A0A8C4TDP7_ERPCA|nr:leukocyte receptor cluster member 1 homolog [Erpetoichthys calabaricus]
MNILPKKSWHVRNKDNVARVRRDEAQAAEEERDRQRRVERAEQEARTEFLRRKARTLHSSPESKKEEGGSLQQQEKSKHLDLFGVNDSRRGEKRGNEEYEKEKQQEKERRERAIGLLVSLGPSPGTDTNPWYLQSPTEHGCPETESGKNDRKKQKVTEDQQSRKEKKDAKLKAYLDPLHEMESMLKKKRSEKQENKREKKGEKRREDKVSGAASNSLERMRQERLQREASERARAQSLLTKRTETKQQEEKEVDERSRPYSSQYHPHLARQRPAPP